MATLTTNQIKSLVYNAIGRASETANVDMGSDTIFKLPQHR